MTVKSILDAHDGHVGAESNEQGTTLWLSLAEIKDEDDGEDQAEYEGKNQLGQQTGSSDNQNAVESRGQEGNLA
jgi:hypothetical protein